MHYQQGVEQGNQETLLYNAKNELTEASSCNAFIVKNGIVITPPLDHKNYRVLLGKFFSIFCAMTAVFQYKSVRSKYG